MTCKKLFSIFVFFLLIALLVCSLFNNIFPVIVFIPTYEYLACDDTTEVIDLTSFAFLNKSDADSSNLMIRILDVCAINSQIDVMDEIGPYKLCSITSEFVLPMREDINIQYINVELNSDNLDCYIGELSIDYITDLDNENVIDPTKGIRETVIDEETAKALLLTGEEFSLDEHGNYVLRQLVGRNIALTNNKIPYAITPNGENVTLSGLKYGLNNIYYFDENEHSVFVGEIEFDNQYLFGVVKPVINFEYGSSAHKKTGSAIASKVILIPNDISIKDLFFRTLNAVRMDKV